MNVTAGNPYAWSLISESGFEIEVAPREFGLQIEFDF